MEASLKTAGRIQSRGMSLIPAACSSQFQKCTSSAGRQTAGKRPRQRDTDALSSARTFGANHNRGLPRDR